jgi:hypothetical protein
MRRFGLLLALVFSVHAAEPDFTREVQPILAKRCSACHGAGQQMAGLRLDSGAAILKGSKSGVVVTPGDSTKSRLLERVSSNKPGFKMPPAGVSLSEAEIATIKAWIDGGAKAPAGPATLWSLVPIKRPSPPAVQKPEWVRNPIDAFVLARLESEKIEPSPEASKSTLLRRVSLDLTGLPPTPKELEEFLNDKRPDAYERAVDRLLASPHYGEKWARQWLDLARYADSDGYEKDLVRPYAWRYRNWVIDALNADMPFDEFTVEQIAGDLLPNPTTDQRIATGFHRNVLTNREAGVDRAEARFEQNINRTGTIGTVWLGLTVGCAQCHNHKFDPISQKEFYQLFAYVSDIEENDIEAPMPGEIGPYLKARPEYDKQRAKLLEEYGAPAEQAKWESRMRQAVEHPGEDIEWDFVVTSFKAMVDNAVKLLFIDEDKRTPDQRRIMTDDWLRNFGPEIAKDKPRNEKLKELKGKIAKLDAGFTPLTHAMTVAVDTTAPKPYIALGGDYRSKGAEVTPGLPAVLTSQPVKDRLALARWLCGPENPLTARVAVNRIWQEFFGRGIVRTSDDFGTQGEKPTHPELLDWLASEFRDNGWSRKRMHRLIVTSAAYRQSSAVRKELNERDPENTLISRQTRLRLPAELVRDVALSASGLISTTIGGPSVRPPQPAGVAELRYGNGKWVESTGADRYRRGLYIQFQRTAPYPQLMNFDAPDSNMACTRRSRSNTPLQALNLLNDPVFFESAQALAVRILRSEPNSRIDQAFRLCLARDPNTTERERIAKYLDSQQTYFETNPNAAQTLMPVTTGAKPAEAAAWVAASRVLMNTDEFIVRE